MIKGLVGKEGTKTTSDCHIESRHRDQWRHLDHCHCQPLRYCNLDVGRIWFDVVLPDAI
jgi:hypothetical protein